MSQIEKLIMRFSSLPKDFTYDEMVRLLVGLGFEEDSKGKTSGSRVGFHHAGKNISINIHKPHPDKELKRYILKQVLDTLKDNNLIQPQYHE